MIQVLVRVLLLHLSQFGAPLLIQRPSAITLMGDMEVGHDIDVVDIKPTTMEKFSVILLSHRLSVAVPNLKTHLHVRGRL